MKNNLPSQFRANREWIHVFVIDNKDKAIRLRSRQFKGLAEKDICVYSAVLDIHQVDLSTEDLRRVEEAKKTDVNVGKGEDEMDVDGHQMRC